MKFGWLAAVVCLAIGVGANAATLNTNPGGTEGSSLFLTVWNGTDKSIVVDLGVNAVATDFSSFSFNQNFSSQLTAAFGSTSTNFQYSVVAVSNDIFNQGIWTTSNRNDLLPGLDFTTNSTEYASRLTNYVNGNPLTALGLGQTNGPTGVGASSTGYYAGSNFNGSLGGTFPPNMGASIGTSMFFYSLLNDTFTTGSATGTGILYASKWLLSDLGELTYSGAPIPLPAGIYMLGAALLGLVGVGRRARVATPVAA